MAITIPKEAIDFVVNIWKALPEAEKAKLAEFIADALSDFIAMIRARSPEEAERFVREIKSKLG